MSAHHPNRQPDQRHQRLDKLYSKIGQLGSEIKQLKLLLAAVIRVANLDTSEIRKAADELAKELGQQSQRVHDNPAHQSQTVSNDHSPVAPASNGRPFVKILSWLIVIGSLIVIGYQIYSNW